MVMDVDTKKIDLTSSKDGGVLKEIKKEGFGDETAPSGTKVIVHYTGKLTDGTVFDSSVTRGDKFTFNLGKGQVIKAWDLCVASMKRGEICEVTCAAPYAYGKRGSPPKIPPNATLIFEIELFDWEGEDITEDEDKGILKEIISEGNGEQTPNDGASVEINLIGKHDGKVFDERDAKFVIGEDVEFPSAIYTAAKTMKKDERCKIVVKSQYGFGQEGNEKFGIPSNATLEYNITMKDFVRAKETWEMDDNERLDGALNYKDKGAKSVKAGDYLQAIAMYEKVIDYLDHHEAKEDGSDDEKALIQKWYTAKVAAYLNSALCHNKLKQYSEAVEQCDEALKMDPNNEKAYFRRGEAFFAEKVWDHAKSSFQEVLKINSSNKAASNYLTKTSQQIKLQRKKELATFSGMFDKFVKEDEAEDIKRQIEMQKERAKAKAEKRNVEKNVESGDATDDVPAKDDAAMETQQTA